MRKLINYFIKHWWFFFILTFSLTPLVWFYGKGNVLINGVDTNFPLDPLVWFIRRMSVWNPTLNAGEDFSSSTAGLFFHFIQVVPYLLGFSLQVVQIISFIFWFSLIVFSSLVFARIVLPKKFIWQLLFVVFYSFNIYLFNSWENVKVANLSLMSGLPLALSILTLLKEKRISVSRAVFYSTLVGIVVSGSGINPSYFVVFFLILVIYEIGILVFEISWGSFVRSFRDFFLLSSMVILVNAFWIFPTLNFIYKNIAPQQSITTIGFNDWVDSLSENTSLVNVLRMQGAWDWYAFDQRTGLPLYIPYALNYFYQFPFIAFSFLIPAIAIVSLIFRNKKKNYLYLSFGLMLIVGVFLCAGTHQPTGQFYRYLLEKLPFFSLFRSPWYIFAPLLCLSLAGLVSLLFSSLDNQVGELRIKLAGYVIFAVGLILVIGNLFYCYPLITGKIFRPGRADGFYVSFPSYLFDTQKWLLSDVPKGRIIEYPDDEITQFSWGYRGIESILNLFSSSDSLFLPLNATSGEIAKLVKRYYLDIKRGAIESSQNLAYKMRAEYLFEKKDVNSLGLDLPERIKNLPVKNFSDEWFFYKLLKVTPPKIYPVNEFYTSYPFAKADEVVSVLPGQVALINPEDSIVKKSDDLLKDSGQIILAENSQAKDFYDFSSSDPNLANRLIDRDLNEVNFMFSVPADDYYQPVLESYSLGDYGLSDLGNLRIEIDDQEDHWKQNYASDSYVYFDKVFIKKGDHKITLTIDNKNLVSGGDFQGNTKINESSHGEKKVAYSILAEAENKYLGILNTGKANVSADFVVSDFDPLVPYNVQFKYKQTYGNNALVLAGQNNKNTLLKTEEERLPNYPEWNVFNFYYDPVKADSEMKVMLSAPFTNDPLGTKVSYDDLAVFKVFMNNLMFVKEQKTKIDLPEVNYQEISPTKYKVSVKNANGPHVLIFSENYSPGWQVTGTDKVSKNFIINHFSVNMFANAWYLADTPKDYELEINYRPQKLFDLGAGVAILTVIFSIAIVIKNKVKEK